MRWNYRIVEKDGQLGIHEVYYNGDEKKICACTREPVAACGDDVPDLKGAYKMMAEAFKAPVLKYEDIPEMGTIITENGKNDVDK